MSGSLISQSIAIASDEKVDVTPGGLNAKSSKFNIQASWDPNKDTLEKASLSINAKQPYSSGADVYCIFNGFQVGDTLHWDAFDTSEKELDVDVSSGLQNGSNSFQLVYEIGIGTIFTQECVFSAALGLSFLGTYEGKPPASTTPVSSNSWFLGLKAYAKWIIGGVIIIGAIYFISKITSNGAKFRPVSWFKSLRNTIPI